MDLDDSYGQMGLFIPDFGRTGLSMDQVSMLIQKDKFYPDNGNKMNCVIMRKQIQKVKMTTIANINFN